MDREGGDHFLSFLHIISSKQQQQDVAGGHYKVTIEWKHTKTYNPFPQYFAEMMTPQWNCVYCAKELSTKEENRVHIQRECKEREPWG